MNAIATKSADLSTEQKMLGISTDGPSPKSKLDWGIKELAVEPGEVQAKRMNREQRFESLPPDARTMFERVILEQHVDGNDLRPAYWLEEGAARSRAVCKVDATGVDYADRTGSWSGTGFLVAPGILCTNHHVINSTDVAARSRILFDFAALPDGTVRQTTVFKLRPDRLFWTSPVVQPGGDGGFDVTFVADAYKGEEQDVDLGGWNIEWFNKRWEEKLDAVARIVVEMNFDIWVFVETSREATDALANHLVTKYGTKAWGVLESEDASPERQITTVMWNTSTVKVERLGWPDEVKRWFQVDSRQFDTLGLEAVHGKVFDRYPEVFKVTTTLGNDAAAFNLVPIHLKAKGEGSIRRQMASRLLAAAMA